jgi:hypothetical protein
VGPLTPDGETAAVTQSSIAADIHQTLDGQLDFFAKIALHSTFVLNQVADTSGLFFTEILDLPVAVDSNLFQDPPRAGSPELSCL